MRLPFLIPPLRHGPVYISVGKTEVADRRRHPGVIGVKLLVFLLLFFLFLR